MNVIIFVAGNAVTRCFAVLFLRFVTAIAGDVPVFSCQHEIGHFMIEFCFVQVYDVGFAAFMICVTNNTRAALHRCSPSVKAGSVHGIGFHRFVAIQAEGILVRPGEVNVTRGTLRFDLRMTLDNGPRHDQGLDSLGGRRADVHTSNRHHDSCFKKIKPHLRADIPGRQYMCTASTCTSADMTNMKKNGK